MPAGTAPISARRPKQQHPGPPLRRDRSAGGHLAWTAVGAVRVDGNHRRGILTRGLPPVCAALGTDGHSLTGYRSSS